MLYKYSHSLYVLSAMVFFLWPNPLVAGETSVEINYETLNSLGSSQTASTLSPVQLQKIEPSSGSVTLKALSPLPKKKPAILLVKSLAPVPPKPPVRGATPTSLSVLRKIGRKPQTLGANNNTPPAAPVETVSEEYLVISDDEEKALDQNQVLAAIDPSLIKSTIEQGAENIEIPKPKNEERKQAGSIQRIFLSYTAGQTDLPQNIEAALSPDIIAEISHRDNKRLSIYAYATSEENNESEARRIALARALGLREFLVSKNIKPKRIDIHPMGLSDDELKKDRVEISLEDPGAP